MGIGIFIIMGENRGGPPTEKVEKRMREIRGKIWDLTGGLIQSIDG